MEVAIQVEQKMGKDENLLEQPLDEENEIGAVVVGHVPWRQGRKNDRGENVGSCEESNVKIEQVNWRRKRTSRSNKCIENSGNVGTSLDERS